MTTADPPTHPRWLYVLLSVALIIRLGWALSRGGQLAADLPDQAEYLAVAKNLVAGEGMRFHDDRFGQDVVAFRAPGYPLLMAACGASVPVIRGVQAVIDAGTVLAIYLLARRVLKNDRLALAAGALVGLNPFLVYFCGLLLSETLFTALLAWGLYFATSPPPLAVSRGQETSVVPQTPRSAIPMERRDVRPAPTVAVPVKPQAAGRSYALVYAAILLSVAVLVRPAGMFLPALILAATGWVYGRGIIRCGLLGAGVTFLVLLPWAARNHYLLGRWIWTTTNAGHTAYDGFGPQATGESNLADLRTMADLRFVGEVSRDDLLASAAREAMLDDPARSARLAAVKIARTWSPVPLSDAYGSTRNRLIGLAYAAPLFGLVVIALVRRTIPVRVQTLCLLPAIYFTATVALSVGSLRYRLPAEPPMAVLAASTLSRRRLRPRAAPATAKPQAAN